VAKGVEGVLEVVSNEGLLSLLSVHLLVVRVYIINWLPYYFSKMRHPSLTNILSESPPSFRPLLFPFFHRPWPPQPKAQSVLYKKWENILSNRILISLSWTPRNGHCSLKTTTNCLSERVISHRLLWGVVLLRGIFRATLGLCSC
jgi:hypothetical protein